MTLLHQAAQKAVEAPLHSNHRADLRYVLKTLERALPAHKKDGLRGDIEAAINGMRYIIQRTEEAAIQQQEVPSGLTEDEVTRLSDETGVGERTVQTILDKAARIAAARLKGQQEVPSDDADDAVREFVSSGIALDYALAHGKVNESDVTRILARGLRRQEVPSEPVAEQIDTLLNALDDIAHEYNSEEYGLPMIDIGEEDAPINKLRDAVREWAVRAASPSTTRKQEAGSGWRLVPVEATPEMMAAAAQTPGIKAIDGASQIHQARGYPLPAKAFADGPALQQAWRAMLAAAPSTPENAGGVPASDQRQRFEAWADDQGFPLRKLETSDGYLDLRTQGAWDAWQACAAHGVPLPDPQPKTPSGTGGGEQ